MTRRSMRLAVTIGMVCPLLIGCARQVELAGDVFIVTRGAGNYKLGLVTVNAYDRDDLKPQVRAIQYSTSTFVDVQQRFAPVADKDVFWLKDVPVPKPIASAKTDAEGKFRLSVPRGDVVLVAHAERYAAGTTEHYVWVVPVDGPTVTLSNDNMLPPKGYPRDWGPAIVEALGFKLLSD